MLSQTGQHEINVRHVRKVMVNEPKPLFISTAK